MKKLNGGERGAFVFFVLVVIFAIFFFSTRGSSSNHSFSDDKPIPKIKGAKLIKIAEGLTSPVSFTAANDGSDRFYILEQKGIIRIVESGKVLNKPFLDLTDKVLDIRSNYDERGLLGMALHPKFKQNGNFYVYYTSKAKPDGQDSQSIIAEYNCDPKNPYTANKRETVIMALDQPQSNHNGGHLLFGPDGYLYIGTGDGGGQGDKHGDTGNGQNTNALLGKILRIDVNKAKPYAIPADNPFASGKGGAKEVYAYGFRNPWRFSFDKENGRLFVGDVGQNKYEEISLVEKGKNYGWRPMEGFHCYESDCDKSKYELPIAEYDHNVGISICGGHIYRGSKYPAMQGRYFFGDWNGRLFRLNQQGSRWDMAEIEFPKGQSLQDQDFRLNAMGEDANGEIYLVVQKLVGTTSQPGYIYQLTWE